MQTYQTSYELGEMVQIGDGLQGMIIGIAFYAYSTQYQVAYFHNGVNYEPWIDAMRLEKADDPHS